MLELTRTFGALYLATLLMQLGSTLLMTYLALNLEAGGGSGLKAGALMAANSLGMILGAKLGYRLIAGVGHIRTYVACAGLISAAVLSHAFTSELWFWLLLRAIVGAAMMCQYMVLESWLNDRAQSHQRGSVLALYMVASYIGMMLGQLVLTANGELGVLALIAVAMAFSLCLVPVALTRSMHPTAMEQSAIDVRLFMRRLPQSLITVLMSGAINGSFFGLASIFAIKHGLSTQEVGLFMAVAIGAGLLGQLPLGLLSDRLPRASLIRGVALLLLVASLLMAWLPDVSLTGMLLLSAAVGFLQFCLYPLGAALANDNIEPHLRVSLAGMLLITFGVGACVGPLLAGLLMEYLGAEWLYLFFAASAGLLAIAVSQRRITGVYLQDGAPLHHQPLPNGIASSTVAVTELDESSPSQAQV
jgi:MFS family permease